MSTENSVQEKNSMQGEDVQKKSLDCLDPEQLAKRYTVRPEQIVALMSLFGRALVRCDLDSEDFDLLIARDDKFADELKTILNRLMNYGQQFLIFEHFRVQTNTLSSLTELCRAANIQGWQEITQTIISDPPILSQDEFVIGALQSSAQVDDIRIRLRQEGYRSATLREALSLMADNPTIMERYPKIVLLVSGSSGNSHSVPLLKKPFDSGITLEFRNKFSLALSMAPWYTIAAKIRGFDENHELEATAI